MTEVTRLPVAMADLPSDQMAVLSGLLAAAFQNEPNFIYIMPDHQKRQKILPWFFTAAIKAGQLYGKVYVTPTMEGSAIWLSPGNSLTFGRMLRTGLIAMPFKVGWADFQRSMRLNTAISTAQHKVIQKPYWYLMALGVAPTVQGQGIGSALLQPVLRRADAEHVPCCLETFSERNLSFYARHGFEVCHQAVVSKAGPHFWVMVRQPQG